MRNALMAILVGWLAAGCTHEHAYTIIYSPNQSNEARQLSSSPSASRQTNATNYARAQTHDTSLKPVSSNPTNRIYFDISAQPQAAPPTHPPQGIGLNEDNPWNPQDTASTDADRAIVRQIRHSVRQDYALSMASLKITAQNGHVVLGGAVENQSERKRLDDLCRNTPGVVNVQDKLTLKSE